MKIVAHSKLLFAAYTIGSLGALLQIVGGYWDVSWHVRRLVETFFTPAHTVLYTGVLLVGLAAILGILLVFSSGSELKPFLAGLKLAILGVGLQSFAGFFDNWWHSVFGFDPVLFSPPHAVLIFGMAVNGFAMTIGVTKILRAQSDVFNFSAQQKRMLQVLGIASFTALWLDLNSVVYLLTDVQGIAFTFRLGSSFVRQAGPVTFIIGSGALALTGVSVLLGSKKVLEWKGAMSLVAVSSAVISVLTNIVFRGFLGFVPLYLAFLLPVFVLDMLLPGVRSNPKLLIVAAAPLGLFAFYLDGWYSVGLWSSGNLIGTYLLAPILVALAAGALNSRISAVTSGPFATSQM